MDKIDNATYYTIIVPIIVATLPILYAILSIFWNRKWVVRQRNRGKAVASFGNITGRVIRLAFREDPFKFFKKVNNKIVNFIFSIKGINIILLCVTVILIAIKNNNFWLPFVISICIVWIRTAPILSQRNQILKRMYEVAASSFHYKRGAELDPWSFVKIKKWETLTVPGETQVTIPAAWDSSSIMARDGFERHFNTTVTDDNSWIYDWQGAKSIVVCQPINHLPTMAQYPGSEEHEWNSIPLGIGTHGEVSVDLNTFPHALVCGTTGSGKQLSLKTPLLTSTGWKTIGTVEIGDKLYTTNGKFTTITHLHPIITPEKAYKVTFKSGEKIVVDAEHLWSITTKKDIHQIGKYSSSQDIREFLSPKQIATLTKEYNNSSSSETIDIPGIKKLVDINSSSTLYRVAKQVGVAELVNKTVKVHYKQPEIIRNQKLVTVDKNEFIKLYNEKQWIPTFKNPVSPFMAEKLYEIHREVKDNDLITLESILQHTRPHNKISQKWFTENFSEELSSVTLLNHFINRMNNTNSKMPTKIYDINSDHGKVSFYDLLSLTDETNHDNIKNIFFHLTRYASSRKIITFKQKQVWPQGEHSIKTSPIKFYPKKLYIKALLQRAGVKVNDEETVGSQVSSTRELALTLKSNTHLYHGDTLGSSNHYILPTKPLKGTSLILPVEPYTLGAYLGDGYSSSGRICGEDSEVFSNIEKEGYVIQNDAIRLGYINKFHEVTFKGLHHSLIDLGVAHKNHHTIKHFGVIKHIPDLYLQAEETQRRQLLRGLLDTDGSVKSDGRIVFSNTNKQIIDNTITLIASLGYVPYLEKNHGNNKENSNDKDVYHVIFHVNPLDHIFGLTRKNNTHQERYTSNVTNHMNSYHKILSIKEVKTTPMRCLSVDSEDRLFLVGHNLVPTHNSVLQRNIIFHCIQHNDMWRFLGVDVKRVELTPFKKYEETVLGIGADLEDGVEIVRYAKEIMESRYKEMEDKGLNDFRKLIDPATGKPPYAILVMVDEAFMFMSPEGAKSDEGKMRDQLHAEASTILGDLARLGRAAGIHLVLATQRPDATVIKGELKANLDVRVAAGRLDATPSSMVLDSGAATLLPGNIKGRGVVRIGGEQEQFQGYFAEQGWIDKWLEEHPGVEPALYPLLDESSPSLKVEDELAKLEEGYNFDDGKIDNIEETSDELEKMKENLENKSPIIEPSAEEHVPSGLTEEIFNNIEPLNRPVFTDMGKSEETTVQPEKVDSKNTNLETSSLKNGHNEVNNELTQQTQQPFQPKKLPPLPPLPPRRS